ncbi:MAG: DUF5009 domain-containing protein [Bacteroides sp.]|nr:DUF5009 domain-containing protein [Bacteroides sp.]
MKRIAAVDIFRAITMLLMLFVNDFAGMKGIPHWMMHAGMEEDMMGFSDLIFPAFLFCMGMSVPLALQNRERKGDSLSQRINYVVQRSFTLIIMGLFSLNSGGVSEGLSHQWFLLLMVVGFFLVWGVYPKCEGNQRFVIKALKLLGVLLLLGMVVYKDMHGKPFHIGWWGILGLIGWTYAVCAFIYLFTQRKLKSCVVAWVATLLLCVLNHASLIPETFSSRVVLLPFIPGGWTHHALGMSGVVCTLLMQRYADRLHPKRFLRLLCVLGITMLLFAFVAHQVWIISKIQATPSWLFYSLALFFPLFALCYWLTDVKGKAGWFVFLKPAGEATLTCYILPYVWYSVQQLLGLSWPVALCFGFFGLLKAFCFALLIVWLTGWLVKGKVKLKV